MERLDAQGAALRQKDTSITLRPRILPDALLSRLIALACSQPPEGKKRWTLRLLAAQVVELQIVETVSYETVRQTLKETNSGRI